MLLTVDEQEISIREVPSGNLPCGIGYIAIPKNVDDIPTFKIHCYRTHTVSIYPGIGYGIFNDVAIDVDSMQKVIFPEKVGEYGSPVVWVNIPKHNKAAVIACLKPEETLIPIDEQSYRITKTIDDNSVDFSIKAKTGTIDISIAANNQTAGKVNINLANQQETCEFNVFSKGSFKVKTTKVITLECDELIDLKVIDENNDLKGNIRYKIGEGLTYEDEYGNIIKANKDGVTITSEKILFQKDKDKIEPSVLGDKNADVLNEIVKLLDVIFQAISTGGITPADGGLAFKTSMVTYLTSNGFPATTNLAKKVLDTKSKTVKLT